MIPYRSLLVMHFPNNLITLVVLSIFRISGIHHRSFLLLLRTYILFLRTMIGLS